MTDNVNEENNKKTNKCNKVEIKKMEEPDEGELQLYTKNYLPNSEGLPSTGDIVKRMSQKKIVTY